MLFKGDDFAHSDVKPLTTMHGAVKLRSRLLQAVPKLNFADGFDCILFCEVIEHVAPPMNSWPI